MGADTFRAHPTASTISSPPVPTHVSIIHTNSGPRGSQWASPAGTFPPSHPPSSSARRLSGRNPLESASAGGCDDGKRWSIIPSEGSDDGVREGRRDNARGMTPPRPPRGRARGRAPSSRRRRVPDASLVPRLGMYPKSPPHPREDECTINWAGGETGRRGLASSLESRLRIRHSPSPSILTLRLSGRECNAAAQPPKWRRTPPHSPACLKRIFLPITTHGPKADGDLRMERHRGSRGRIMWPPPQSPACAMTGSGRGVRSPDPNDDDGGEGIARRGEAMRNSHPLPATQRIILLCWGRVACGIGNFFTNVGIVCWFT